MKRMPLICLALVLALPAAARADKWRIYEKCRLIECDGNDGDSFHIKCRNKEYVFRLYYVDAPETDLSYPERVKEQAAYWDLDEADAVRLGKEAARFTRDFLRNKEITVHSTLQDARGRGEGKRYYAMVQVGEDDLAQALVGAGLARIYGFRPDLPDGTRSTVFYWRLKTAEREARQKKFGGWAERLSRAEELQRRIVPADASFGMPAQPAAGTPAATARVEAVRSTTPIEDETLRLKQPLPVYSLHNAGRQVTTLPAGTLVRATHQEAPGMVRVRFTGSDGKLYEAQCRRVDLGL